MVLNLDNSKSKLVFSIGESSLSYSQIIRRNTCHLNKIKSLLKIKIKLQYLKKLILVMLMNQTLTDYCKTHDVFIVSEYCTYITRLLDHCFIVNFVAGKFLDLQQSKRITWVRKDPFYEVIGICCLICYTMHTNQLISRKSHYVRRPREIISCCLQVINLEVGSATMS